MDDQLVVSLVVGVVTGVSAAVIVEVVAFAIRRRHRQRAMDNLGRLIAASERGMGLDRQLAIPAQEAVQREVWFDQWVAFLDECQLIFVASFQHLKDEEIGSFGKELTEQYRLTRAHQRRADPPAKSSYDLSFARLKEALPYSTGLFGDGD